MTYDETTAAFIGRTLWVDAGRGDDETGDGSKGRPWSTLAKAAVAARPGDTVRVAAGDYRGPLLITTDDTTWVSEAVIPWPWRLVAWLPWVAEHADVPVRRAIIHAPPGVSRGLIIGARNVTVTGFGLVYEGGWTAAA